MARGRLSAIFLQRARLRHFPAPWRATSALSSTASFFPSCCRILSVFKKNRRSWHGCEATPGIRLLKIRTWILEGVWWIIGERQGSERVHLSGYCKLGFRLNWCLDAELGVVEYSCASEEGGALLMGQRERSYSSAAVSAAYAARNYANNIAEYNRALLEINNSRRLALIISIFQYTSK